ncbi:putative phosphoenolpyruvate pyruvate domain-containing protein [Lyophyllum shimeji]|uniref:Phosphoenolpyruvate pyruvate domain-containing protein n=1 Tax=Lyophyllum shimeji TaxID=47721 RepID=A0A9P3UL66_LYOSH|nr:putative phosphoenolpyruvate pyruvate domain-containing protein [Lyophyllum shimeji]
MASASNTLLNAFKANKTAFGVWLTTKGYFHARTVAQASPHLSWIVLDCEHGLIPLVPDAAESIAAIHSAVPGGAGPSAVVRIPATGVSGSTSWQIKYALDAGARGILVPMVSTVEKAREVVADSKFPPAGRRGFGSPFTHGNWGVNVGEYLTTANENISVMVQIENQEGVQNVEQIAAVEGIDVLFVGPYDLSISLGYAPPNPDPHPDVEKIIQKVLKAAHGAGKKCAIYCSSGAQSAKRAAEGFDMINVTSDMGAMTQAIAQNLAAAVQ